MNRGHISSSELIDAKLEEHRISTARHCPNCRHKLDCKPVSMSNSVLPFCTEVRVLAS